jgi:predicted Na+-dependent transporter
MFIVFIAMTMRSATILSDPITSAITIVPLIGFYAGILAVGTVLGRLLLSTDLAISLVYVTSMRNLSIAVAIVVASDSLPTEAVLPIALAYIIQPPLGAVYMHYRRDVVDQGLSVRQVVANLV